MSKFTIHSEENHPEKSAEVIKKAKANYGFVPNLIGAMSEAPAAAETYMFMSEALRKSSFKPAERHVAWFTVNNYHECDYCMAAHTGIAKSEGIPDLVIETARTGGDYADAKLQALKVFTIEMLDQRGWVKPEAVDSFIEAGFTQQNVLELILLIAHKTLSNYTNHVVHTPVDNAFSKFTWQPSVQAAE